MLAGGHRARLQQPAGRDPGPREPRADPARARLARRPGPRRRWRWRPAGRPTSRARCSPTPGAAASSSGRSRSRRCSARWATCSRRSIAKSATLRHEFAPDLPPVLADATQLRQVALNLIVNASDALGDEPGTITLRTGLVDPRRGRPRRRARGSRSRPGRTSCSRSPTPAAAWTPRRGRASSTRSSRPRRPDGASAWRRRWASSRGTAARCASAREPGEGTRFEVLLRPAAASSPSRAGPVARAPGSIGDGAPGRAGAS